MQVASEGSEPTSVTRRFSGVSDTEIGVSPLGVDGPSVPVVQYHLQRIQFLRLSLLAAARKSICAPCSPDFMELATFRNHGRSKAIADELARKLR